MAVGIVLFCVFFLGRTTSSSSHIVYTYELGSSLLVPMQTLEAQVFAEGWGELISTLVRAYAYSCAC